MFDYQEVTFAMLRAHNPGGFVTWDHELAKTVHLELLATGHEPAELLPIFGGYLVTCHGESGPKMTKWLKGEN